MLELFVTSVIAAAYFIESIFGFGGGIMHQAVLANFLDLKTVILLGLYGGTISALFIFLTSIKQLNAKKWIKILVLFVPGVLLGAQFYAVLSMPILLKLFAIALIGIALLSLFFKRLTITGLPARVCLFLGGIMQGCFGTGGPFVILGYRDEFSGKSELRATMAAVFMVSNIIRLVQLGVQGELSGEIAVHYWWLAFAIPLAISLGYLVHLKLNEERFRDGLSVLILIAGAIYLFK